MCNWKYERDRAWRAGRLRKQEREWLRNGCGCGAGRFWTIRSDWNICRTGKYLYLQNSKCRFELWQMAHLLSWSIAKSSSSVHVAQRWSPWTHRLKVKIFSGNANPMMSSCTKTSKNRSMKNKRSDLGRKWGEDLRYGMETFRHQPLVLTLVKWHVYVPAVNGH